MIPYLNLSVSYKNDHARRHDNSLHYYQMYITLVQAHPPIMRTHLLEDITSWNHDDNPVPVVKEHTNRQSLMVTVLSVEEQIARIRFGVGSMVEYDFYPEELGPTLPEYMNFLYPNAAELRRTRPWIVSDSDTRRNNGRRDGNVNASSRRSSRNVNVFDEYRTNVLNARRSRERAARQELSLSNWLARHRVDRSRSTSGLVGNRENLINVVTQNYPSTPANALYITNNVVNGRIHGVYEPESLYQAVVGSSSISPLTRRPITGIRRVPSDIARQIADIRTRA